MSFMSSDTMAKVAAAARAVAIEECAKIAELAQVKLQAYPSDEARDYYESGADDESMSIAIAIRALLPKQE